MGAGLNKQFQALIAEKVGLIKAQAPLSPLSPRTTMPPPGFLLHAVQHRSHLARDSQHCGTCGCVGAHLLRGALVLMFHTVPQNLGAQSWRSSSCPVGTVSCLAAASLGRRHPHSTSSLGRITAALLATFPCGLEATRPLGELETPAAKESLTAVDWGEGIGSARACSLSNALI